MPVTTIPFVAGPSRGKAEAALLARLIDEWRSEPMTPDPKPDIRQEQDGTGRVVHLYVIWEDWALVEEQRRAEIIMDAYEQVAGREAALGIAIAMGLTAQEASRMGFT